MIQQFDFLVYVQKVESKISGIQAHHVRSSIIHNSPEVSQSKGLTADDRINKIHTQQNNIQPYRGRKTQATMWMNLEVIMPNEASHKRTNIV